MSLSGHRPRLKPRFFYGYIVVTANILVMVLVYGALYSFGVFFKPVLNEFSWTRAMTSIAFSLSWILQGLFAIFTGRLTDRLGPRRVITLCGLLSGLGYLLMSQVSSIWQLYLFYGVLIGFGVGAAWVPTMSTVTRWFSQKSGMMAGIVLSGSGLGTLIAPPVANWLISIYDYDWRKAYAILGGVVLVGIVLAAQFMKRGPVQVKQHTYDEDEGEMPRATLRAKAFSLKEAICTKQFWVVFTMLFCCASCTFTVIVHIAPHADDLRIPNAAAASMIATLGGVTIVGRVALGSVADKIGNKPVFIIGFILSVAALLMLVPAREAWMLYLAAAIIGFGWGATAVAPSLTAELFGLDSHGMILEVITLGYTIGAGFSPFAAGYIFDVTDSYQGAFLLFAGIGIVGLILASALKTARKARL